MSVTNIYVKVRYPEKTDAGDPANFGGIWDAGWC